MLKDYGHHWHDGRQDERAAWAGQGPRRERVPRPARPRAARKARSAPSPRTTTPATCCTPRKSTTPRGACLAQIPGLELRDLPETELCCGAAGTYNLTQPEMSARLSRRKLENIRKTGARVAITSNAGCALQIAREAREQHVPAHRRPPNGVAGLELSRRPTDRMTWPA